MSNQVKVSITRRGMVKGSGTIHIKIEDVASGLIIAGLDMDPYEFAECITGVSSCNAVATVVPNEYGAARFGKKKQVETVYVPVESRLTKDTPESFFDKFIPEGWELWNDGLSTQQDQKGVHKIVICRYVEVEQ